MNRLQNGYIYAFLAATIWSGFILISRLGGISELGAYDVIAIRYLTCTLIVLPIWWFKFRFNLLDKRLIICSLIGGLTYALFTFQGFELTTASHAAILLPGLMPMLIILFTFLINGERHSMEKWSGVTIITLGVLVLLWPLISESELSKGHLFLLAGSICWSLMSVLIKRWKISPWQVTVSLAVITCIIYLPAYIVWLPKKISTDLWSDIAIQAFYQGFMATIVQMILYVKAVQDLGPSNVGSMMALVPLVSGLAAIFIFNESASFEVISGLLLVSLGALIAHNRLLKAKPQTSGAL